MRPQEQFDMDWFHNRETCGSCPDLAEKSVCLADVQMGREARTGHERLAQSHEVPGVDCAGTRAERTEAVQEGSIPHLQRQS